MGTREASGCIMRAHASHRLHRGPFAHPWLRSHQAPKHAQRHCKPMRPARHANVLSLTLWWDTCGVTHRWSLLYDSWVTLPLL